MTTDLQTAVSELADQELRQTAALAMGRIFGMGAREYRGADDDREFANLSSLLLKLDTEIKARGL